MNRGGETEGIQTNQGKHKARERATSQNSTSIIMLIDSGRERAGGLRGGAACGAEASPASLCTARRSSTATIRGTRASSTIGSGSTSSSKHAGAQSALLGRSSSDGGHRAAAAASGLCLACCMPTRRVGHRVCRSMVVDPSEFTDTTVLKLARDLNTVRNEVEALKTQMNKQAAENAAATQHLIALLQSLGAQANGPTRVSASAEFGLSA